MDAFMTLSNLQSRRLLYRAVRNLGLTSRGAEIGVCNGRNASDIVAEWMEKGNADQKLYLIDYWRSTAGGYELSDAEWDDMYEKVKAAHRDDPRIVVMRMSSEEAANAIPDGGLDWVYIDANHSYEPVKRDLEVWYPKVCPGGVFSGHDYVPDGMYDGRYDFGVKRAVDEFVRARGLGLFVTMESDWPSWYAVKP